MFSSNIFEAQGRSIPKEPETKEQSFLFELPIDLFPYHLAPKEECHVIKQYLLGMMVE